MSSLELALCNMQNKLYSLESNYNTENYLDANSTIYPIFSNIYEGSIFSIYSQTLKNTTFEPVRFENIHLLATKPFLNNPYEPLETCNVLITNITFSNFNKYFSSRLEDTLEFYITDLCNNIRLSLESNKPFITGIETTSKINTFKIINNYFIIQPDFRDITIDINIRAINSANVDKYDILNYLSDPYTIKIIEPDAPPILQIYPMDDTIIFPYTDYYINNHINSNVVFLETYINSVITNKSNIISLYYEYELPIDNIVFTHITNENCSNYNNSYYYKFDYRGSNNETSDTIIKVMIYDPFYYNYYNNNKIITNIIIKEPPPIKLKSVSSCNLIESDYNSFEFDFNNIFSNNLNNPINYSLSSPLEFNTPFIEYTSLTNIIIHTDYRDTQYNIIIKALDPNYLNLPTFYTINITERSPPIPLKTVENIVFNHSLISTSNIDLNTYFSSGTSNNELVFSLTCNNYPTDYYADIFSITDNILYITQDLYYNSIRTLIKTVVATDTIYNVSNNIEIIFYQKPIIQRKS